MKQPKILLVYANPMISAIPVAPYGMERIAQSFQLAGCHVTMIAPFIEEAPLVYLEDYLSEDWSLIGLSVRNIDDALVVRHEEGDTPFDLQFFLDDVRPLVVRCIESVGSDKVVVGGTALSSGPLPVLRYLGASIALSGSVDDLCWRIGRGLVQENKLIWPDDPRVVFSNQSSVHPHRTAHQYRGFAKEARLLPAPAARMGEYLGLTMARGGRVAVAVDAGCDRRCSFCVEAHFMGFDVIERPVEVVVREIEQLMSIGVQKFWLATSEINVPNDRYAISLFQALSKLKIDVMTFIQVAPVSEDLLNSMEDCGLDPTTLSFEFGHLDADLLRKGAGPANRKQIDALVDLWIKRGYDTLGGSVLLGAHPEENWKSIDSALDAALEIDKALPNGLGLAYATGARVYPQTTLANWIAEHPEEAKPYMYGVDDPSFVRPVVFSKPTPPRKLLRYVNRYLSGAKGQMGPMNAEAAYDPIQIQAEALVNRGIWRLQEGSFSQAEKCFRSSLQLVPQHLEGLAQLAMLLGRNQQRGEEAIHILNRLSLALPFQDARQSEIKDMIARIIKRSPPH